MTATITRTYGPRVTRGALRLADDAGVERFRCVVLELPWLSNARNVSCIPEGVYPLRHFTSATLGDVLAVENVPGRDLIRIHAGNMTDDTRGCPIVGATWLNDVTVTQSRATLAKLLALMPRGQTHRLVVRAAGLDALTPFLMATAGAAAAYYYLNRRRR